MRPYVLNSLRSYLSDFITFNFSIMQSSPNSIFGCHPTNGFCESKISPKFRILRRKKYIKITTSHQTFRFKAVVLAKVKSRRTLNVISIRLSNGHSHGLVDMHVSPPSCRQFLGHRIDISCNFFSE